MTLQEYVKSLQNIINENPEYKELLVVYASDEEGNYFHELSQAPSLGDYYNNEFKSGNMPTAICIN